MNRKILLVDDDPNILNGFKRQLRKEFDIETALGGKAGLDSIAQRGPFGVIVTDMQMPEMNGVQFLQAVRRVAPESVRLMLTGNADQKTAIDAVNDGHVFRFLNKPCTPESLTVALEAGIEQHRLLTAERELLSKTLSGSVSVLTEILALVNPTAFGHATKVRRIVKQICQKTRVENAWEVEIATMLSQVGCVTIPETTLAKLSNGEELSDDELQMYAGHPQVGYDLIAKIPRLRGVAEIIRCQQMRFDGSGSPSGEKFGTDIPLGARILKLVIDFVQLTSSEDSFDSAISTIHDRTGWYDPAVVEGLAAVINKDHVVKTVTINQLEEGMVLVEHVLNKHGDILLARGQEVTASVCIRLKKFASTPAGVQEPIRVRLPVRASDDVESLTETDQPNNRQEAVAI